MKAGGRHSLGEMPFDDDEAGLFTMTSETVALDVDLFFLVQAGIARVPSVGRSQRATLSSEAAQE